MKRKKGDGGLNRIANPQCTAALSQRPTQPANKRNQPYNVPAAKPASPRYKHPRPSPLHPTRVTDAPFDQHAHDSHTPLPPCPALPISAMRLVRMRVQPPRPDRGWGPAVSFIIFLSLSYRKGRGYRTAVTGYSNFNVVCEKDSPFFFGRGLRCDVR